MTKTSCKIVCPFCSLLCDDVTVSLDNNRFEVKNKICHYVKKDRIFSTLIKTIDLRQPLTIKHHH